MSLHKLDESKKRLARKTGKLPKPPKKPKLSASLNAMESYKERWNAYVKRVNEMASDAAKKEKLQKAIRQNR